MNKKVLYGVYTHALHCIYGWLNDALIITAKLKNYAYVQCLYAEYYKVYV